MGLRNTTQSFGSVTRVLHWGMALVIVVAIALIELTELAPRGSALRRGMRDWHMQSGLLILALVWFRVAWRLANTLPAIEPPPPAWQLKIGHAVEWTFYALMIVLPILGVAMVQADGRPIALLGVDVPMFMTVDKSLAHDLEDVHETLGNLMLILIGAHVGAALWHKFVLRDNTLGRITSAKGVRG